MKPNTPSWRLNTGKPRRGVALIITLTIMALLLILATGFVVNMRTERQISFNYRRQIEARQAALAGLDTGIAKMARFFTDAEFAKGSVATMAGRFYYTNGVSATVTIPSGVGIATGRQAYGYTNMLMFSWILPGPGGVYTPGFTNWADKVNMNGGNFLWSQTAGQSGSYLPIANPCVNTYRSGGNGTSWGPDKTEVWASYLWSNANRGGSKFAFWIDDESSKINLSNAGAPDLTPYGYNNLTNSYSSPTPFPYGVIVQPDVMKHTTKNLSSVDIRMLDVGVACPAYPYPVANGPWTEQNTLNAMESARNSGGSWLPFQSPDEVLSLNTQLTMNDYQAVKSCVTAYSVENTDYSCYFRASGGSGGMLARTNVSNAIVSQDQATTLYNFLTLGAQANIPGKSGDKSSVDNKMLAQAFATGSYGYKYSSTEQPFLQGNPGQLAANIVSYLMDPSASVGPVPIGSSPAVAGSKPYDATYTPSASAVPTGPCGLWKAAYMNEIALSFAWQPDQKPDGKTPVKWQLWAALCVELINPYEVSLPISNVSYREQYNIIFDNAGSQLKVNVSCNNPAIPGSINEMLSSLVLTSSEQLDPHTYSAPSGSAHNYTNLMFTWAVTPISPTNVIPPTITALSVNLPTQIRQMMWSGMSGAAPSDRRSIIDWYSQTTQGKGSLQALGSLSPQSANVLTANAALWLPPKSVSARPDFTDGSVLAAFWGPSNPTKSSIAKNDPRLHAWYGPYYGAQVTLGAMNAYSVNYANGDNESQSYPPERRSNFVIANAGMRSVGELGFIHTGKPWRSLSLQYYGAQTDESSTSGNTRIPDWALMDLFTVNSLPIYGRININTGGWHLGNTQTGPYQGSYPQCATFEERRLYPAHPNMVVSWPDASYQNRFNNIGFASLGPWAYMTLRTSAYNGYRYNNPIAGVNQVAYDTTSVPLAAALGVIPNASFRNKLATYISSYYRAINAGRTAFAPQGDPSDSTFNPNKDIYNPFYSVAQICELPCMNYLITGNGTQKATTDADQEDVIRRIYGVLTTHGDAFTVHAAGYSDSGEARLIAVVERCYDPLAAQLSDRSKFRIRQIRWLTD